MATIKKLDKNKWEVRYDSYDQQGNRHQRRKTFPRATDAKAFLASLDTSTPYEASYVKFDTWIDQWFDAYSHRLEAITVRTYRRMIDRLKQHFGSKKLSSITPSDVEIFFNLLAQPNNGISSKPLAASSIRHYRAVLHRALTYAVRDGYLPSNPLDRVEPPHSVRKEITLPDTEALQKHIASLSGTPMHLPVCIALLTGMRRSEIMGLQWDCVDFDQCTISVKRVRLRLSNQSLSELPLNSHTHRVDLPGSTNNVVRDCTKNKHTRVVSIPQTLVDLLKKQRLWQMENRLRLGDRYIPSEYVCTMPTGRLIRANELSASLSGICRFHDLRHLSASLLLDAGYSAASVADRIGHTTPATTMRIYAHSFKNRDRLAADELDRHFQIKT